MSDYTDELDRLQTYARQHGDTAVLQLAADDLAKLRATLAELHPKADAYAGAFAELQKLKRELEKYQTVAQSEQTTVLDGWMKRATSAEARITRLAGALRRVKAMLLAKWEGALSAAEQSVISQIDRALRDDSAEIIAGISNTPAALPDEGQQPT